MSKKIIKLICLFVLLAFSGISCKNPLVNSGESKIDDDFDNDQDKPSVAFGFSLPLQTINSINSETYIINGDCDANLGDVTVKVGAPEVIKSFSCDSSGSFTGSIDLSSVTSNPPSFLLTQGELNASVVDSELPVNDQNPIATAPTATPPSGAVSGLSYSLELDFSEAKETVTVGGLGISPTPQTYESVSAGLNNMSLQLTQGVEVPLPNVLTISSTDEFGNATTADSSVSIAVDTLGPRVSVTSGGTVIQGQAATYTVTVTDMSFASPNYNVTTSGPESAVYNCTSNPCNITTGVMATAGTLTLTVGLDSINDGVGNSGPSVAVTESLTVNAAGALGFNDPLPLINVASASTYPVSGVCDQALGDVTVSVSTPVVTKSIPCDAPGVFTSTMDVTAVTLSPAVISVSQGVNTTSASPSPVNDQTPIAAAPVIVDEPAANGSSVNISMNCTEAGEVVSFNGTGLNPGTQVYNCPDPLSNPETVTLNFGVAIETADPNTITVSSVDANGNTTTADTNFSLPIDNVAPVLPPITNGGEITEGEDAIFTVTITEGGSFSSFTPMVSSGSITSGACVASPCTVTVSGANPGLLSLSVGVGVVTDAAGNTNTTLASSSLNVIDDPSPTLSGVSVTSTDGDADTWYEEGDVIQITLGYSEDMTVSGVPTIPVTLSSGAKTATYVSGSGSSNLVFSFSIGANDLKCDGVLSLGSFALNGGSVQDSIGQDADHSGLAATVAGAKIDTISPTPPGAFDSHTATDAYLTRGPTSTWDSSATDSCGVTEYEYAIGLSVGASDVMPFNGTGSVGTTYQAENGVGGATFSSLAPGTNYYGSVKSKDAAGNVSTSVGDSFSFVVTCNDPFTSHTLLGRYDSSDESSIIDENGRDAADILFTGSIDQWLDISAAGNDLTSPGGSAFPLYTSDSGGVNGQKDSYVFGDGVDDTLRLNLSPDVSSDFTFVFVMKPENVVAGEYDSFFSNSTSPSEIGSWQLDKGGSNAGCSNKFRVLMNDGGPTSLCGPNYDTERHVFIVSYNSATSVMKLSVDGVDYDSRVWTNTPTFRWLKLFENRAGVSFQSVKANEVAMVSSIITSAQNQEIGEYLVCKWGVSL